MERKVTTNCLIRRGDEILLGLKKTGFGKDKWNGFGGKVKEGESVEQALQREVLEETGVKLCSFEEAGILEFTYLSGNEVYEVHVFRSFDFEGEPKETDEMKPQWFSVSQLPFESMWPDDLYWFPLLLKGERFKGKFIFKDYNAILGYKLEKA